MRFIELYSSDSSLRDAMFQHTTYSIFFNDQIVGFARNDSYGVEVSILAPSEAGLLIDSGDPAFLAIPESGFQLNLRVGDGIHERKYCRLYKKLFSTQS